MTSHGGHLASEGGISHLVNGRQYWSRPGVLLKTSFSGVWRDRRCIYAIKNKYAKNTYPAFFKLCQNDLCNKNKQMANNNIQQDHCRGVYPPPSIKGEEIPFPRYSQ